MLRSVCYPEACADFCTTPSRSNPVRSNADGYPALSFTEQTFGLASLLVAGVREYGDCGHTNTIGT